MNTHQIKITIMAEAQIYMYQNLQTSQS